MNQLNNILINVDHFYSLEILGVEVGPRPYELLNKVILIARLFHFQNLRERTPETL